MYIDKKYISKIKRDLLSYANKRREIIKLSGDALHAAKKAIFAMHRDELKSAKKKIDHSKKLIKDIQRRFGKDRRALKEGAYKAAVEELVEALLLYHFLTDRAIPELKQLKIDAELYVAGLSDVPGELHRYAIKAATEGNVELVKKCAAASQEIIGSLIDFDLTSYLRNKFDQAKSAVRKIEHIVYEISLK